MTTHPWPPRIVALAHADLAGEPGAALVLSDALEQEGLLGLAEHYRANWHRPGGRCNVSKAIVRGDPPGEGWVNV